MAASAFAFFSLEQGRGRLLPAQTLWDAVAKALGKEDVFDQGLPKHRAEFLVYGACHNPVPVKASRVTASVGGLSKSLAVFADRHWGTVGVAHKQTFTAMPLDWSRAFGGEGFEPNPRGAGISGSGDGPDLLPNIEHPGKLVVSRSDRPAPAGLNAYPPDWPQRTRHLGRFNRDWMVNRWPHLPADTNPEYCNTAPADQRFSGFFHGDEPVLLENMHPFRRKIASCLPGVRGRLFCRRLPGKQGEPEPGLEEIPIKAETLWLFPGLERGVLLFRGKFESADEEAGDIELMLGAWEDLAADPLPVSHYQDKLEAKPGPEPQPAEQPPASKPAAPPPPEPEPPKSDTLKDFEREMEETKQELKDQLRKQGKSEEEIAALERQAEELSRTPRPPEDAHADKELPAAFLDLLASEFGIHADFMNDPGLSDEEKSNRLAEKLMESVKAKHGSAIGDVDDYPAGPRLDDLSMAEHDKEIEELLGRLKGEGVDTSKMEEAVAQVNEEMQKAESHIPESPEPPPEPPPESPPGDEPPPPADSPLTREQVLAMHARGESLAEKDLTGLDLSKADLQEANLRGAVLEGADLSKADLQGADLSMAVLTGADLSKTRLKRARLDQAYAEGAKVRKAKFANASLAGCQFKDSDFERASFAKAQMAGAVFDQCSLRKAVFRKTTAPRAEMTACNLKHAVCTMSDLSEADLRGADLSKASLYKTQAPHLRLQEVQGRKLRCVSSNLQGSRADPATALREAFFSCSDLSGSCWEGADLRSMHVDQSVLNAVNFSKTDLSCARLRACRAQEAVFSKARLEKTDLGGADLLNGSMRRAELRGTSLCRANLYGVDCFKVVKDDRVELAKANLGGTFLDPKARWRSLV
jgi:uncharacterized protein YjbI with pentapeptide repeats